MSHVKELLDADEPVVITTEPCDDGLQLASRMTVDKTSETSTAPLNKQSTNDIKDAPSSDPSNKIIESDVTDTIIGCATPKASRELKSILALSKEAKLDTNIVHKRKSVEPGKLNNNSQPKRRESTGSTSDNKNPAKRSTTPSMHPLPETDASKSMKDKELSNKIKIKSDCLQESSVEGASEGLVKKASRQSFNGDLNMNKEKKDKFCWRCHYDGIVISCETCPRSYHQKCVKQTITNPEHWPCPECMSILKAESTKTRSPALKGMTLEHLCGLLKFAVKRMLQCTGSEFFLHPVSDTEFPNYRTYIVQPMDLTRLEKNIKNNLYGSTQAFEADAKWVLHNSYIFNSSQSKITSAAKSIIKICKQEMQEIENCATCYRNANTKKDSWFVEVCPKPHLLLWAKLKGFPYWPAKAMITNSTGMVDVRFFGAHDRAWVPSRDCFLYSRRDPNSTNQKKNDINECVKELETHITNLKKVYGEFNYAPYRTLFDPERELEQLQLFLPAYKPSAPVPQKPLTVEQKDVQNGKNPETVEEDAKKVADDHDYSNGMLHDDRSMEGYGTDDEVENQIDNERRKALLGVDNSNSNDVQMDNDSPKSVDVNDPSFGNGEIETQVENSSFADSRSTIGKVRTRGGYANITGKVKTIPKQISQFECRKRFSSEEFSESPQKLSRRNSDQSVKSDSSRLSNISEKINKVDISENMEISVGNDDTGNISISENVSDMSDSSKSELLEWIVDMKRKPVQVNVENKEFHISPQNKAKISDKLIKKFAETGESSANETNAAVEVAKKQIINESSSGICKTQTDLLLEKYRVVVAVSDGSENSGQIQMDNIEPLCAKKIIFGDDIDYSTVKVNLPSREPLETCTTSTDESKSTNPVETEPPHSLDDVNIVTNACNKATAKTSSTSSNNEDGYNGELLEDTQIDEANIRNIIHSSLNELPLKKIEEVRNSFKNASSELTKDEPKPNQNPESAAVQNEKPVAGDGENAVEATDSCKKRKMSADVDDLPESKISKVVTTPEKEKPVEKVSGDSILLRELQQCNKANTEDDNKAPDSSTSTSDAVKSSTTKSTMKIVPLVEIKSEPCSEDEFCETDDLEAKRELLSALNITEKTSDATKLNKINDNCSTPKEMDKTCFKVVDNLTKVIDKVASSYSQEHEGEEITLKSKEKRKEIYIKPLSKMQASPVIRQKARKTFPAASGIKRTYEILRKDASVPAPSSSSPPKVITCEPQTSTSLMFLTQPQPVVLSSSVLPPNQQITYTPNMGNPILTMVQHPLNAFSNIILPQNVNVMSAAVQGGSTAQTTDISESQNYIPQSGAPASKSLTTTMTTTTMTKSADLLSSNVLSEVPSLAPISTCAPSASSGGDSAGQTQGTIEDLGILKDVIPDSVAKAVNEMLSRPLPKLKPRPPSAVSASVDGGTPSSAGPVATKINSLAHRISDYFRGMLVETLNDLSENSECSEATMASLKLEIESLKHQQTIEIMEIKKNVCSILKDIQKSILEERERTIEETRAKCEAEAIKRVEEAKSKQWCANCLKEAQFYCCWNTSYCDYPCQQKHWPKHMSKCAQTNSNSGGSASKSQPQHIVLRPTAPPKVYAGKTLIAKPTKVIMNKGGNGKGQVSHIIKTSSASGHITIVESTPGNYELVGNGPISVGGKLLASTSVVGKIKSGNVITVTSPSNTCNVSATSANTPKLAIISQTKAPATAASCITKRVSLFTDSE